MPKNNLITELAEHVDFYVGNEHYEESHEEKQRIWLEKYTELVIDECIKIAMNAKSMEAAALLVTHFGIKQ